MRIFTIATRQSPLALAQVDIFINELEMIGISKQRIKVLALKTQGDKDLSSPLFHKGGKGLFIREIEQALLDGQADFAVHSLKDLPLESSDHLSLSGLIAKSSPADLLVSPTKSFDKLSSKAVIGTSSMRRASQLRLLYPNSQIKSIRGSVQRRLEKNNGVDYDFTALAQAGLERLGLINNLFTKSFCMSTELTPAFCQGVIGIQARKDDKVALRLLEELTKPEVLARVTWERRIAAEFEASCQSAFGVHVLPQAPSFNTTIYCYKSDDLWQRQNFDFTGSSDLMQKLKKYFSIKSIDWAKCDQVLF